VRRGGWHRCHISTAPWELEEEEVKEREEQRFIFSNDWLAGEQKADCANYRCGGIQRTVTYDILPTYCTSCLMIPYLISSHGRRYALGSEKCCASLLYEMISWLRITIHHRAMSDLSFACFHPFSFSAKALCSFGE